jgi:hypothetical protein
LEHSSFPVFKLYIFYFHFLFSFSIILYWNQFLSVSIVSNIFKSLFSLNCV